MVLYGITIVTSAFLLFLVQPIIEKQILPRFGGSAAVWTTCVPVHLITREALHVYLRHLKPDGIVASDQFNNLFKTLK